MSRRVPHVPQGVSEGSITAPRQPPNSIFSSRSHSRHGRESAGRDFERLMLDQVHAIEKA
jgi:hypothetical protein